MFAGVFENIRNILSRLYPSPMTLEAPPTEFSTLEEHVAELSKVLGVTIKTPRCAVLYLGSAVGKLCSQILVNAPPDFKTEGLQESSAEYALSLQSKDFWAAPSPSRDAIYEAIAEVFFSLLIMSNIRITDEDINVNKNPRRTLDLRTAILKKMALNAEKYPVSLSKGKSFKYTEYSHKTGIGKDFATQSTLKFSLESDNDDSTDTREGSDGHTTASSICPKEEEHQNELTQDRKNLQTVQTVPGITRKIRNFANDREWPKYHTPRNLVLAMLGETGELAGTFMSV